MVPVLSLWLPIVLSAVIVFLVSSAIHMVLGWHADDFKRLENEAAVQQAFRDLKIAPVDYLFPAAKSMSDMKIAEYLEKVTKGPIVSMTVSAGGPPTLGKQLALWFLYGVLVSVFAAYIAGRALGPGAHYLAVFRFAGATAFCGYSLALLQQSIWWRKSWRATLISMGDSLIYALMTAGTFGWLWPR